MIRQHFAYLLLLLLSAALPSAQAAVPKTLAYQATLTDGAGQPVTGDKTIRFSLYAVETGGTAFWTEEQALTLAGGRLSAVLGGNPANPLDTSQFNGETWIGVKVGTDTEMPRQKFSSVAYAFQAGDGGVPRGGIILWSGAVDAIPAGWVLCNGSNGTPDLRDRFVVGAGSGYPVGVSGGIASNNINHSHSISGDSPGTSAVGDHQHSVNINTGDVSEKRWGVDQDGNDPFVTGSHYHNVSGSTGAAGGHSHTVNSHSHGAATGAAGSDNLDNRPPYYALAYIMKL